jgi:hypothetical protein
MLGHGGILRTKKLAQRPILLAGHEQRRQEMVDGCEACQQDRPSQPREENGCTRGRRIPCTASLWTRSSSRAPTTWSWWTVTATTASWQGCATRRRHVIQTLEGWFLDYGFPRYITSDSGRQFLSDYDEWCAQNDILPVTSSPHNHESNGLAESAVKQMKALLKKTEGEKAFRRALLHQRNTPRSDGAESPAELFFGRTDAARPAGDRGGGRERRLGDGRPAAAG